MGWLGKVIGGTLGFAIGGPLGAVAGAVFGHTFDRTSEVNDVGDSPRTLTGEQAQFTFFVATFSMLAKLAKADGQVSKDEVDSINRFMLDDLNLTPQSRMVAMNIFNTAINSPQSFHDFAIQFYGQFHSQPQILAMMVDILLRVSIADGEMSASEEELIISAIRIFNFSDEVYQTLKSQYVQAFDKYYAMGPDGMPRVLDLENNRWLDRETAQLFSGDVFFVYGIYKNWDMSIDLPIYRDKTGWDTDHSAIGNLELSTKLSYPANHEAPQTKANHGRH